MNIILPTKQKLNKNRKTIYISVGIICLIAIIVVIYTQISKNFELDLIGKNNISDDEYQELKTEFDNVFNNAINIADETHYNVHYQDKELVFTGYHKEETQENVYNLNVNIPYINIRNEKTIQYNQEIISTFQEKAESIIKGTSKNSVIYTVDYNAFVKNGILSLVIRSNLKEGTNAQRVIIQTYNYDLVNDKEVTISELLNLRNIDKSSANNKIKNEIKQAQEQVEELKKLGYTIYERNPENEMYDIDKATEFFIGENEHLYVVYAYGNTEFTSEMDFVIF